MRKRARASEVWKRKLPQALEGPELIGRRGIGLPHDGGLGCAAGTVAPAKRAAGRTGWAGCMDREGASVRCWFLLETRAGAGGLLGSTEAEVGGPVRASRTGRGLVVVVGAFEASVLPLWLCGMCCVGFPFFFFILGFSFGW